MPSAAARGKRTTLTHVGPSTAGVGTRPDAVLRRLGTGDPDGGRVESVCLAGFSRCGPPARGKMGNVLLPSDVFVRRPGRGACEPPSPIFSQQFVPTHAQTPPTLAARAPTLSSSSPGRHAQTLTVSPPVLHRSAGVAMDPPWDCGSCHRTTCTDPLSPHTVSPRIERTPTRQSACTAHASAASLYRASPGFDPSGRVSSLPVYIYR